MKEDTVYYQEALSFGNTSAGSEKGRRRRLYIREQWLWEALNVTEDCDAVFLDPDNGIEVPSVKKYAKAGPKYVFLDEIASFTARGQTAIVYHHLCRQDKHELQIRRRREQLNHTLGVSHPVLALRFRPYSPRVYFIIPSQAQEAEVTERVEAFMQTQWNKCFELCS